MTTPRPPPPLQTMDILPSTPISPLGGELSVGHRLAIAVRLRWLFRRHQPTLFLARNFLGSSVVPQVSWSQCRTDFSRRGLDVVAGVGMGPYCCSVTPQIVSVLV